MKKLLIGLIVLASTQVLALNQDIRITFTGASASKTSRLLTANGSIFKDLIECQNSSVCVLKFTRLSQSSIWRRADHPETGMSATIAIANSSAEPIFSKLETLHGKGLARLNQTSKEIVEECYCRNPGHGTQVILENELIWCVNDPIPGYTFFQCGMKSINNKDITEIYNTATGEKFRNFEAMPYGY